jgi:hypothetical protein
VATPKVRYMELCEFSKTLVFLPDNLCSRLFYSCQEEMRQPAKKVTRIFVARIPSSVSESDFRSHFERYGEITDLYMPKDYNSKQHRGIGFITFSSAG